MLRIIHPRENAERAAVRRSSVTAGKGGHACAWPLCYLSPAFNVSIIAALSASVEGEAANHASRTSSATAGGVDRMERARTFASFHVRAPRDVSASMQSAARTPRTLFAAIDTPVPVQQHTMPQSHVPRATASPTARPTLGQSCGDGGARAPKSATSCPRSRRSLSSTVVSSAARSLPRAMRTRSVFASNGRAPGLDGDPRQRRRS